MSDDVQLEWYDLGSYLYAGPTVAPAAEGEEAERIAALFRGAMALLASGVAVVTARDDLGRPRGLTATSVTSYSANPPSVLVCIDDRSFSYRAMTESTHFGVNLLAAPQQDLALLFASKDPEKFDKAEWRETAHGTPVLAGVVAHLVCRNDFVARHADHAIVIGSVVDGAVEPLPPLVYWNRAFYAGFGEGDA